MRTLQVPLRRAANGRPKRRSVHRRQTDPRDARQTFRGLRWIPGEPEGLCVVGWHSTGWCAQEAPLLGGVRWLLPDGIRAEVRGIAGTLSDPPTKRPSLGTYDAALLPCTTRRDSMTHL